MDVHSKIFLIMFDWAAKYPYRFLLCIFILAGWIYSPSFSFDFVNWDDYEYVVNNPLIRSLSLSNLQQISQSFIVGNYHPLTTLSLAVNYHFHGLNPLGYHATNLILHFIFNSDFHCQ
jgi:hypothetical protein